MRSLVRSAPLLLAILSLGVETAHAASILVEDFEDGVLDSRITASVTGSYGEAPGIYADTRFGSAKAYSFGVSTCGASCFSVYMNSLLIDLGAPTYVGEISFREMEVGGNWGSEGYVFLDGLRIPGAGARTPDPRAELPYDTGDQDFGRSPINDNAEDDVYRQWVIPVNATIQGIELLVWDITAASAIHLDDLMIGEGEPGGGGVIIPEPSTLGMVLGGAALLFLVRRKVSRGQA